MLYPIATVGVPLAINLTDFWTVCVAADDAVKPFAVGELGCSIGNGGGAQSAVDSIQEGRYPVAQPERPMSELQRGIEAIAVDDEITFPIGRRIVPVVGYGKAVTGYS